MTGGLEHALSVIIELAVLIFSCIVHEVSHGACALRLGDDTAKRAGRLTLNPAAHLDPVGSVILPLLMLLAGGPVFGFAKPVPYDPSRLRHPKRDEVLVALAGPASNLLQALLGGLAFRIAFSFWDGAATGPLWWILLALSDYVYVNLMLMCFNLIPLPPLDGSAIISPLLNGHARELYYKIQHYSLPILLVLLYILPSLIGFDPLGSYLDWAVGSLYTIVVGG